MIGSLRQNNSNMVNLATVELLSLHGSIVGGTDDGKLLLLLLLLLLFEDNDDVSRDDGLGGDSVPAEP